MPSSVFIWRMTIDTPMMMMTESKAGRSETRVANPCWDICCRHPTHCVALFYCSAMQCATLRQWNAAFTSGITASEQHFLTAMQWNAVHTNTCDILATLQHLHTRCNTMPDNEMQNRYVEQCVFWVCVLVYSVYSYVSYFLCILGLCISIFCVFVCFVFSVYFRFVY